MSNPQLSPVPPAPSTRAFAITALVLGILAVALSIIPWVGPSFGLVGVIFAIIALRKRGRKGMGVAGLVLSIIGILAGAIVLLFVAFVFPAIGSAIAHGGYDDGAGENSRYDENYDFSKDYLATTPCYSFTGPKGWINHENPYSVDDCLTNLVDHGDLDDTDRYVFDPEIYGSVAVQPDYNGPTVSSGDIDLDGATASVATDSLDGWTTETISVTMPQTHKNYYGEFDELIITLRVEDADAEDVLDTLVDTWKWK